MGSRGEGASGRGRWPWPQSPRPAGPAREERAAICTQASLWQRDGVVCPWWGLRTDPARGGGLWKALSRQSACLPEKPDSTGFWGTKSQKPGSLSSAKATSVAASWLRDTCVQMDTLTLAAATRDLFCPCRACAWPDCTKGGRGWPSGAGGAG